MTDKPEKLLKEALALLKAAPPRESINDDRFWKWRREVEDLLKRVSDRAE